MTVHGLSAPRRPVVSFAILALFLSVTGCVHRPPTLVQQAFLSTSSQDPSSSPFLIEAFVAGAPVRLLVDTGAQRNTLRRSFVQAHDLEAEASEDFQGVGHQPQAQGAAGGRTFVRVVRSVPVRFLTGRPGFLDFWVFSSDALLEQIGVDGILSPQALMQEGQALVIDGPRHQIRFESSDSALRSLQERQPGLSPIEVLRCESRSFLGGDLINVPLRIHGQESRLLLDTGSMVTVLWERSPAAAGLSKNAGPSIRFIGLTGSAQLNAPRVTDLNVGGSVFERPLFLSPARPGCEVSEGILGGDVLRHCLFAWTTQSVWLACSPP